MTDDHIVARYDDVMDVVVAEYQEESRNYFRGARLAMAQGEHDEAIRCQQWSFFLNLMARFRTGQITVPRIETQPRFTIQFEELA